jgi:hypothetical protein
MTQSSSPSLQTCTEADLRSYTIICPVQNDRNSDPGRDNDDRLKDKGKSIIPIQISGYFGKTDFGQSFKGGMQQINCVGIYR